MLHVPVHLGPRRRMVHLGRGPLVSHKTPRVDALRHPRVLLASAGFVLLLVVLGLYWQRGSESDGRQHAQQAGRLVPSQAQKDELRESYLAATRAALVAASDPTNETTLAELANHFSGQALAGTLRYLEQLVGQAREIRGGGDAVEMVQVLHLNDDFATIRTCYLERSEVYDVSTESLLTDEPPEVIVAEEVLRFDGSRWRIDKRSIIEVIEDTQASNLDASVICKRYEL